MRVISQYTIEAISVGKEIAQCVIMISTLRIYFGKEILKATSETLVDILEPTSFHLLNSIINSAHVKQERKFQFLDWLFGGENNFSSIYLASSENHEFNSVIAILFTSSDGITGVKLLMVGPVVLLELLPYEVV